VGVADEVSGYPPTKAPAGWGCLRSAWVSLAAGTGGMGVPEKYMGIPCRRRGRGIAGELRMRGQAG